MEEEFVLKSKLPGYEIPKETAASYLYQLIASIDSDRIALVIRICFHQFV